MGTLTKVLSGTAVLIGLYLIVSNATNTTKIITSAGSLYTSGVKTLQGR